MWLHCWAVLMVFAEVVHGDRADTACTLLTTALPQRVARPVSLNVAQYALDNDHWAVSSEQLSRCSVQPASVAEVATIFNVINQTRTPWAVKGGGHAYNLGWSSTPGLQIALTRFKDVSFNANTKTVHIGAGMIWDDVYAALAPLGVNVVGGRVPGVGVAGFTLGGGYSWFTQQYGLTIDTVVSFDLVTPTGHIMTVTEDSYADLFFGLRGGGNNFGIVTGFTLKTFPQTQVYGGTLIYLGHPSAVADAIVDFDAKNADPKATILATYTSVSLTLQTVVFLFYDAPTPPDGTFDMFLMLPALVNSVRTRSFPEFVQSLGLAPKALRIGAHTVPIIQYTKPIVEQIMNQTQVLSRTQGLELTALSIEPYNRNLYDHSRGGAYPHSAAHPWTPFEVLAIWPLPVQDAVSREGVRQSARAVQKVAIAEGQSSADAIVYNNYAMAGTPLELLYGENLPRLRALHAQVDPHNLMSLTGGWRL